MLNIYGYIALGFLLLILVGLAWGIWADRQFEEHYCPNCGTPLTEKDHNFECESCGWQDEGGHESEE
jgi:predicted amidophosphoribosyltransferase